MFNVLNPLFKSNPVKSSSRSYKVQASISYFPVCIVSIRKSSLCPPVTPWSRREEGCISSSRPETWSRAPAAPGWWSSCRGFAGSSSWWSSSGSVTGCCCRGSPDGRAAARNEVLSMRRPWIQKNTTKDFDCFSCHCFCTLSMRITLESWKTILL